MKSPVLTGYPLEISGSDLHRSLDNVATELASIIEGVEAAPIDLSHCADQQVLDSLREPFSENSQGLDQVLKKLFTELVPPSLSPISGGFMGYVPGGGITLAAIADLISGTMNRYVGAYPVAPALSEVEASVIRWFARTIGMPSDSQGFMTSGGSLANQSALSVARTVTCGDQFQTALIYLSDQAHGCLSKAARLNGFPARNIRVISTDHKYRMCLSSLKTQLDQDKRNGLRPMFVAANAGTTNTGAIDPLESIAEICKEHELWFHVDAAYGGFFALTERGRQRLRGLSAADSVALDPHKTLFLPYGTGALLVRRAEWLRQTFHEDADYLPDSVEHDEIMDFRNISPELTRPFRGLRVWLPLKVHGVDAFRACLDEKLDLIQTVFAFVKTHVALEVLAEPELSIMAFGLAPRADDSMERVNERSKRLLELINTRNRVHLTGTMLNGRFALRVAIVVYRTHQSHVDILLEDLQASIKELEELEFNE